MSTYQVEFGKNLYEVDAGTEQEALAAATQAHQQYLQGVRQRSAAENQKFLQESDPRFQGGVGQRVLENLGAGMDTAWQGAKQLGAKVGLGQGVSDAELAQSRADKKHLAAGTVGGGLLQIAGEAAPTMVLPAGAVGRGALALAGAGAGAGAVGGALMPTLSTESKLANATIGAVGGAAIPAAGRVAGKVLPLATKAGREAAALTRQGGRLQRVVGKEAMAPTAQALAARPTGVAGVNIPLTTAQAAHMGGAPRQASAALAQTELGVRPAASAEFGELARRQNEGLGQAVRAAGREGSPANIESLQAARDAATGPRRAAAMSAAQPWQLGQGLRSEVARMGAESAPGTPSRRLAALVQQTIDENPTPQQLYSLRKLLTSKLAGPSVPGDEMAAIVKGADRDAMQVVRRIDEMMNQGAEFGGAGPGAWSGYLDEYAQRSRPVDSAAAQRRITESVMPEGGPTIGGAPEVTAHRLSKAIEKHGTSKRYGDVLLPQTRRAYSDVRRFARQMEEPMKQVKLGGTGGGGAQTATQLGAGERAGLGALGAALETKLPFGIGAGISAGLGRRMTQGAKEEVAQLMLNPDRARAAILAKINAGRPLSAAERAVAQSLVFGGAATSVAGANSMQNRGASDAP